MIAGNLRMRDQSQAEDSRLQPRFCLAAETTTDFLFLTAYIMGTEGAQ
jgi:hypothetical protein